jgi:hypothetical protein
VIVAVLQPRRYASNVRIPERGRNPRQELWARNGAVMLRTESKRTTDRSEAQKPNPSPAANDADQPIQNRHGIRPGENDRVKLDADKRHVGPVMRKTRIRLDVGENLRRVQWIPGALPDVKARSDTLQRPARPRGFETAGSGTPCRKESKSHGA